MRRSWLAALALSAVLALGGAAIATAASTTVRVGNLILTFGSNVSPKKLPKKRLAPIALRISGKGRTSDGTHPSALRQLVVDIDKNGALYTRGLPVCRRGQLEARNTSAAKRVCGKAIVGKGRVDVQISFPEQRSITAHSPLTLFNGGSKGGKTTLFIHSFITVPVPAAIVTTVTIKKVHKGRFGFHTIARIPVIAGGSGSVLNFNFKIKRIFGYKGKRRSYISARCRDGRFQAKVLKALFRNEAGVPGVASTTVLRSGLVVPCTPRG
jgi:hypothetical protein